MTTETIVVSASGDNRAREWAPQPAARRYCFYLLVLVLEEDDSDVDEPSLDLGLDVLLVTI